MGHGVSRYLNDSSMVFLPLFLLRGVADKSVRSKCFLFSKAYQPCVSAYLGGFGCTIRYDTDILDCVFNSVYVLLVPLLDLECGS
jgi:hypothetical protein